MSDARLRITRNDLEKIFNTKDQRIIQQFEQLLKQSSETTPDIIATIKWVVDTLISAPSTQPDRLDRLEDVIAPNSIDGMVLVYNSTTRKWVAATLTAGAGVTITNGPGGITITAPLPSTITADLTNTNATFLAATNQVLANGAGAASGTLTNAPSGGNPTKWIAINDNGTTRRIPAW